MIPSKVTNNNTEWQKASLSHDPFVSLKVLNSWKGEVALERQMQMENHSFFPISTIAPTTHIQLIFNKATKLFPTV